MKRGVAALLPHTRMPPRAARPRYLDYLNDLNVSTIFPSLLHHRHYASVLSQPSLHIISLSPSCLRFLSISSPSCAGNKQGRVSLWNLSSQKCHKLTHPQCRRVVRQVAFSPDNRCAWLGARGLVRVAWCAWLSARGLARLASFVRIGVCIDTVGLYICGG